jgi:hypothetical protein
MKHNGNFEKWSANNIFLLIPVIGIVLPVGKLIQRAEMETKTSEQTSRVQRKSRM